MPQHSLKEIQRSIREFYKEHGKRPTSRSSGEGLNWNGVDQWLRKNDYGSVAQVSQDLGISGPHADHGLAKIKKGIRKFKAEHGKIPSVLTGDATEDVGYRTSWVNVNNWLRTHGHGSLAQLCQRMGVASSVSHSLEAIRVGVALFEKEHGRPPRQRDGDATSYVTYRTTWRAVDAWLRRNGTSLGASSTDRKKHTTDKDKKS